jgi:hypothetical protein
MAKKKVADVLAFLKKQGVEVKAEAAEAVKNEFDELELVAIEQTEDGVLRIDGVTYAEESAFRERGADIIKWKEKARKAEDRNAELQRALDAGDSENKKLADKWKGEYEKVKTVSDKLLKQKRDEHAALLEIVPDDLKQFIKLPEKGEELDDMAVLSNLEELTKFEKVGVFKPEELRAAANKQQQQQQSSAGSKTHPLVNPSGRGAGGRDDVTAKPIVERMAGGYKYGPGGQTKEKQ